VTFTVTVAGTTKTVRDGSLSIASVANGVDTLRCAIVSTDGTYRPAVGAEVIATRDGTRIFGGNVVAPRETGAGNQPITPIVTTISAVSFKALADDLFVTETVADGTTLKSFLQTLETNYFGDISVTLSGSQVTGPNLTAMSFTDMPLRDVFNELAKHTGYVWEINYSKVASMFAPSATAAPFDVTVANGNADGDLTVETSREGYANRIVVMAGEAVTIDKTDTFTGDGSTTAFTLTYKLIYQPQVGYGYVTNGAANYETLDTAGFGATWVYDPTANTITRTSAPANLNAISITYPVQFPIRVEANNTAAQTADGYVKTRKESAPYIYDKAQAQELAENLLAQALVERKTVHYSTRTAGLRPGMTQTINVSHRNVNATFTVESTTITNDIGKDALRTEVTAVSGTEFRGSQWREQYKSWLGGSVAVSTPAASSGGGVPFPPHLAVQFNRNGQFGGSSAVMVNDDETSLKVSEDVTIYGDYNLINGDGHDVGSAA
jgi:hypothetical protein